MKLLVRILLIVLLLSSFLTVAYSQKAVYDKLNSRIAALYKNGDYSEATKVAEEVVKVAEKTFGKRHPYVSTSLSNLALLYSEQGKFKKAESAYERSLKIAEDILGKDHPHLINILEGMVKCCKMLGETEKAEMLEKRIDYMR